MKGGKKKKVTAAERTQRVVFIALFVALTACMSQISIPMPSGVPLTLQTFAIAVVGFFLGWKYGLAVVGIYIFLGATGLPVFASFTGGIQKLVGVTGGFIWGFIPFVVLAGARLGGKNRMIRIASGLLGLIICHALGVAQYALITSNSWGAAALVVSMPYLAKDILVVILAYKIVEVLSRRVRNPFVVEDIHKSEMLGRVYEEGKK